MSFGVCISRSLGSSPCVGPSPLVPVATDDRETNWLKCVLKNKPTERREAQSDREVSQPFTNYKINSSPDLQAARYGSKFSVVMTCKPRSKLVRIRNQFVWKITRFSQTEVDSRVSATETKPSSMARARARAHTFAGLSFNIHKSIGNLLV